MTADMDKIIGWHQEQLKLTLQRYFALGDLMLGAMINTGLQMEDLIRRIRHNAGPMAMSESCYRKAVIIARGLTDKQREVIITAGVPFNAVVYLCGDKMQANKARMVAKVKAGEVSYPFATFNPVEKKKMKYAMHARADKTVCENSLYNPDRLIIEMTKKGEPDEEGRLAGLKCMMSRMGREAFETLLVTARRELGWK